MTQVKYSLSPQEIPLGSALGISLGLRLYFTVYPSSCHNIDTVYMLVYIIVGFFFMWKYCYV